MKLDLNAFEEDKSEPDMKDGNNTSYVEKLEEEKHINFLVLVSNDKVRCNDCHKIFKKPWLLNHTRKLIWNVFCDLRFDRITKFEIHINTKEMPFRLFLYCLQKENSYQNELGGSTLDMCIRRKRNLSANFGSKGLQINLTCNCILRLYMTRKRYQCLKCGKTSNISYH